VHSGHCGHRSGLSVQAERPGRWAVLMVRRRSTVRFRKGAPGKKLDSKIFERAVGPKVGPTASDSGPVPGQRKPLQEPASAGVRGCLRWPGVPGPIHNHDGAVAEDIHIAIGRRWWAERVSRGGSPAQAAWPSGTAGGIKRELPMSAGHTSNCGWVSVSLAGHGQSGFRYGRPAGRPPTRMSRSILKASSPLE
jgi:hypothetical protein